MASLRIKPAPRQSTKATQQATVTETMGESSDFTRRALSDACTFARLASFSRSSSISCRPNALTERTDSRPCCDHADDIALAFAHFVRGLLHRLLEMRDKEQAGTA